MCGGLSTNLQASLGTGVEVSPEGGSQQEHVLSLRMLLDWGKEWKYSVQHLQNKNTVRSARAVTVTARLSSKKCNYCALPTSRNNAAKSSWYYSRDGTRKVTE